MVGGGALAGSWKHLLNLIGAGSRVPLPECSARVPPSGAGAHVCERSDHSPRDLLSGDNRAGNIRQSTIEVGTGGFHGSQVRAGGRESTTCHITSFELYPELDNLIAMQNLRTSANKGSDDVHTSLTDYEPNFMAFSELNDSSGSFSYIIPSSDQDMDDVTLGKLLTVAHRGQADYCGPEGVSVSQSSSFVFDGSGQLDGERMVDQSVGFGVTRNTYTAHSKFSENTQAEKVVDRSGKPEERNSSNAHIRTLLEEQRQMIIAEYCEKSGHHELQAAHAEEERRILREELWRQQLEFREVHQQSLTEMEELRKFQSSTFDTFARRKLIEDQNTILELSGRLQELQNEVKLYE